MNAQFSGTRQRAANIFINYRREDSSGHAGRLFDGLSEHFPGRLFMDVDTIEPGVDFVEAIEKAVGSCEVLIVVIGRDWLQLKNTAGIRRLDDAGDFVRLEVETALVRGIRVIPVLVQDAPPPQAEDLPPSLARLARRNAIELSDARWAYDVERLADTIRTILGGEAPAPAPVQAPEPVAPEPAPPCRLARPRTLSALLAVLVLVAAGVLVAARWSPRSAGAASGSQRVEAQIGTPLTSTDTDGPPALQPQALTGPAANPASPYPTPLQPAGPGPEAGQQGPAKEAVPVEPVDPTASEPDTAASSASGSGAVRELPSVTITAPRDGERVGKDVTARGSLTNIGSGQRAFLAIKNRDGLTFPCGEIFPTSDGRWTLEADSSHQDFDLFVVVATTPETAGLLHEGGGEAGFHTLPKGAHIVGPVVSVKRLGKTLGWVKSNLGKRRS